MRSDTLDTFLHNLAARVPAPGGGATAALHAAQAAALVAMVARYSDGPKYAEHAAAIEKARDTADDLCADSLTLAEEDISAFTAVGNAYGLPKATPEEKTARSGAITTALLAAGRVSARVIAIAEQIVSLAEELRPLGSPAMVSDIAAAADAARAAISTSRVNVEANLVVLTDPGHRAELTDAIAETDDILHHADEVTAAVREQILR